VGDFPHKGERELASRNLSSRLPPSDVVYQYSSTFFFKLLWIKAALTPGGRVISLDILPPPRIHSPPPRRFHVEISEYFLPKKKGRFPSRKWRRLFRRNDSCSCPPLAPSYPSPMLKEQDPPLPKRLVFDNFHRASKVPLSAPDSAHSPGHRIFPGGTVFPHEVVIS